MITIYNANNYFRRDEKVQQVERKYFKKGPTYKSASKGELLISEMNEQHRINAARKTCRKLCEGVVARFSNTLKTTSDANAKLLTKIVLETVLALQAFVALTPEERESVVLIYNLLGVEATND